MLISLSGVLMPGPLFAVTLKKAAKSKTAGALIAVGHGIVEFPLMFLIFFVLSQFEIPSVVQVAVGLVGGLLMVFMGLQTFRNRHKTEEATVSLKRDSLLAGVHWLCDFSWYTLVALVIFKSQRFWSERVLQGITLFCVAVFIGFGAYFFSSALLSVLGIGL